MERHDSRKRLRSGFTTGTCAAAASKAAAMMLLTREKLCDINIVLPSGQAVTLPLIDVELKADEASCAIKKDSGDDPDITNGLLIYATVSKSADAGLTLDGGEGVGIVTKPGLSCKVGEAAINPGPRQMIQAEAEKVCTLHSYTGGLNITISVPGGKLIAQRTFNPRLGIIGGISILGTTGIVEPMSIKAWTDTIYLEMKQKMALGHKNLLICPGNYGEEFIRKLSGINLDSAVKCSNFIGETLDYAMDLGFESIMLIGHAGKLVKLAAGIMNTHSKFADARMEILAVHASLSGAGAKEVSRIMECNTTEEAAWILRDMGISEVVFKSIIKKIDYYLERRVYGKLKTAAVLFSNELGVLGQTMYADELIKLHQTH